MDSSLPTDKKPFFFSAADKLATALKRAQQEPTILTLRMRTALAMDATGLNTRWRIRKNRNWGTRA